MVSLFKMENKYLGELKNVILDILKDEPVKIVLFGSRARRDNSRVSDVDIGLIPSGDVDKRKIVLLKNTVEDLNIPYKVEIVNFDETSPRFKEEAMKEAIVWKG